MAQIGIWEGDETLSFELRKLLPAGTVISNHPAAFAQGLFDLLVIAPTASGWAGINRVECKTALLPGSFLPLTRGLKAKSAVSYGVAHRNTVTLSSLEPQQIGVALQRKITAMDGTLLEEQEFLLPLPLDADPTWFLCLTGARLLLTGKT